MFGEEMKKLAFREKWAFSIFWAIALFLICNLRDSFSAENQHKIISEGVIQIHTSISDGKDAPEAILEKAREKKMSFIVFTDWFLKRWEYGILPFRNLIKKKVEDSSVVRFGTKRYLKEIEDLQKKNPDLVVLAGIEATPFYYWEGIPLDSSFCMYDWHKRFLVIGLEDPTALSMIPTVSNRYIRFNYVFSAIRKLWWAVLLIVSGSFLILYKFKKIGIVIIIVGVLFFINDFDFNTSKYNQYQRHLGAAPYQDFIDYVNKKGGLSFWVDPELGYSSTVYGVNIVTYAHIELLQLTEGYTGFSVSSFDKLELLGANSKWDSMLLDYCKGIRKKPIWMIGGLGYEDTRKPIDELKTVLLLTQLNKEGVLTALKNGNIYVESKTTDSKFNFSDFRIDDAITGKSAHIGEILVSQSNPIILISCTNPDYTHSETRIDLIKNGQIIKTFLSSDENINIRYEDIAPANIRRCYYRLKISAFGKVIYTNPIFVI